MEILWEEVGNRIAKVREDNNMTQTQFAELIGISRDKLSRIETGKKTPGDLVPVICNEVHVSADYIYFGKADLFAYITFFNDFDPADIEILFDLLKRFVEALCESNTNELLISEVMRRQDTKI
jgi:transcriptional regulator with XRE-family HTH domain